ncbi:MAG: Na/Pi symporter [Synergistaceae bacterium]|jgi:Na/Pi-cotransporter|nr:Na/Pi symporter [Synergistaceae bacterium]
MSPRFYQIINLLGGISLFLYGVSQSTEAFRSAFSSRAREAMSRFAQKKPRALLFGVILAAVAQGSTVSTSIAISFVDVGMLSLAGAVVVMMGASIGGTFVTFLISLDIVRFSPLFLTVSFLMVRLGRGWAEKAGNVLQALSLILVGMLLLKLGVDPLLNDPAVREAVAGIANNPFAMFFAAFLGTAVLQSSASVMALAVTIAISGALPRSAVFPTALGAHLGSTVTMLLTAAGGRRNARMLGIATFLYKLAGTVAFIPSIPWANAFLDRIDFTMPVNIVSAQVLLVLWNAAIFYLWPQVLLHCSSFVVARMRGADLGAPIYLDEDLLEFPPLAVRLLTKEMIRLTNYIEALLRMRLYPEEDGGDLIKLLPNGIGELTEACEQYMYAIQPPSIAEDRATGREYRTISYAMLSLREISHLTTKRFGELLAEHGLQNLANEVGKADWDKMTASFIETARDAFHAFALGDADLAQRAIDKEEKFEKFTSILRSRILSGKTGRRENSAVVDFLAAERRCLHSALEIVRGDVFIKLMQPEAEDRFGQK